MPMNIGLKYCGGCNPLYDRSFIAARIKKRFPWIILENLEKDITYDWVFVICGCKAECVDMKGLKGRYGVLLIFSIQSYLEIEESMTKFFKENTN